MFKLVNSKKIENKIIYNNIAQRKKIKKIQIIINQRNVFAHTGVWECICVYHLKKPFLFDKYAIKNNTTKNNLCHFSFIQYFDIECHLIKNLSFHNEEMDMYKHKN